MRRSVIFKAEIEIRFVMWDDYYSPFRQYGSAWNMARTDRANEEQSQRIVEQSIVAVEQASNAQLPDFVAGPVRTLQSPESVADLSVRDIGRRPSRRVSEDLWLYITVPVYVVPMLLVCYQIIGTGRLRRAGRSRHIARSAAH